VELPPADDVEPWAWSIRDQTENLVKFVSSLLASARRPRFSRTSRRAEIQELEPRRLMAASLVQALPNVTVAQGSPAQQINLAQAFTDTTTGVQDLVFSAKSDNTALVQTNITAGVLTLSIAPNGSGYAHVLVTALAPDNSTASDNIRVKVTARSNRLLSIPIGPANHSFSFTMGNHTSATISLSGPGSGTIDLGGDGLQLQGNHASGTNQEIESIDLTGTTSATTLTINGVASQKVFADVGDITTDGAFGSIEIRRCSVFGDITAVGGITNLVVQSAQSSTMTFGASSVPIFVKQQTFTDVNFSSPSAIRRILVSQWVSSDSVPETFLANSVGSLRAGGSFTPGLQLNGIGAPKLTLGPTRVSGAIGEKWIITGASAPLHVGGIDLDWDATFGSLPFIHDVNQFAGRLTVPSLGQLIIHGNMVDAVVNLTAPNVQDVKTLVVRGAITNSAILTAGSLGPVSAEALQGSIVFAGVGTLAQGETLPTSGSELAANSTIQSISLKPRGKVVGFLASDVSASNIGTLSLGTTRVNNNGVSFGVAATQVGSISATDLTNHRTFKLTNINDAPSLAAEIAAMKLNLEDFVITVL
jgi:hypothetical protein